MDGLGGFIQDSDPARRMEGVLLVERKKLLGAVDLVEGDEEFGLKLNLSYQMNFSCIVR